MIKQLYKPFIKWSEKGSIFLISDTHFDDEDCRKMDPNWVSPEEQIRIINSFAFKNDTLIHLGDVGEAKYINQLKAGRKILLLGNHDKKSDYEDLFDEIYDGPLFISDRILLSHEPVYLPFCLNIHGHDHSNEQTTNLAHINLAANVCNYTPVNLKQIINSGIMKNIKSIHRLTIDRATELKQVKQNENR